MATAPPSSPPPPIRVGINGFGKVGRAFFFAALQDPSVAVVAINDAAFSTAHMAQIIQQEQPSVSRLAGNLTVEVLADNALQLNGTTPVQVGHAYDVRSITWREVQVDCVVECTGMLTTRERCSDHITGGAPVVILGAYSPDIPIVAPGVNEGDERKATLLSAGDRLGATLAPIVALLRQKIAVEEVLFTAMMPALPVDAAAGRSADRRDWRQARLAAGATTSIVPHQGSSVDCIRRLGVLPADKVSGSVFQVPVQQGCGVDLTVRTGGSVQQEQLDAVLREAAAEGACAALLDSSRGYLISSDCVGCGKVLYDAPTSQTVADGATHRLTLWVDLDTHFAQRLLWLVKLTAQPSHSAQ